MPARASWIDANDVCVVSADGAYFRHTPLPADASPRVFAAIATSLLDELLAPPTVNVDVNVDIGSPGSGDDYRPPRATDDRRPPGRSRRNQTTVGGTRSSRSARHLAPRRTAWSSSSRFRCCRISASACSAVPTISSTASATSPPARDCTTRRARCATSAPAPRTSMSASSAAS